MIKPSNKSIKFYLISDIQKLIMAQSAQNNVLDIYQGGRKSNIYSLQEERVTKKMIERLENEN